MCNWKKKALVLALAGLALFSAAGCSGSADKKGDGKGGEIVLYTSQPEADAQKLIAAFNQDHPDIKVKVFRYGRSGQQSPGRADRRQRPGRCAASIRQRHLRAAETKGYAGKICFSGTERDPRSIHRQGPHLYGNESHHHRNHREYLQGKRRSQSLRRPGQA